MYAWVTHLRKEAQREDWDCVVVVDGKEGTGKSTLAYTLKAIWDERWDLGGTVWDPVALLDSMRERPEGSTVWMDEAMLGLYKRDWYTEINNTLVKAFSIVRDRNLFFIIVLPRYQMLDRPLRQRVHWRVWCHAKRDPTTRRRVRGYARFYYAEEDPWVEGDPWLVEAFRYRFQALPVNVWTEYHDHKVAHLQDVLGRMKKQAAKAQEPKEAKPRKIDLARAELTGPNPPKDHHELAGRIDSDPYYARRMWIQVMGAKPPKITKK